MPPSVPPAQGLCERLGDGARDDVAGAAGGEGDDEADRLLGPGGVRRPNDEERGGHGGGAQDNTAIGHGRSSCETAMQGPCRNAPAQSSDERNQDPR
jgi:hypothetical protein